MLSKTYRKYQGTIGLFHVFMLFSHARVKRHVQRAIYFTSTLLRIWKIVIFMFEKYNRINNWYKTIIEFLIGCCKYLDVNHFAG